MNPLNQGNFSWPRLDLLYLVAWNTQGFRSAVGILGWISNSGKRTALSTNDALFQIRTATSHPLCSIQASPTRSLNDGDLGGFRSTLDSFWACIRVFGKRSPTNCVSVFSLRQKLMESTLTIVNQTLQFNDSEPLKLNEPRKSGWRSGVDCAPTTN
ncbi:hypothetical protein FB451DRAFT_1190087 [Mycena latifolia]|nr:hypothetical protein FB451DRAFT_1190087 [Mycena latifolia]